MSLDHGVTLVNANLYRTRDCYLTDPADCDGKMEDSSLKCEKPCGKTSCSKNRIESSIIDVERLC